MSITRITEFQASSGNEKELVNFLKSLIDYISSAQGCLSCQILQHTEDSSKFTSIEKWNTIESHTAAIAAYPQEKMLAAMMLFASMPQGNYYSDI